MLYLAGIRGGFSNVFLGFRNFGMSFEGMFVGNFADMHPKKNRLDWWGAERSVAHAIHGSKDPNRKLTTLQTKPHQLNYGYASFKMDRADTICSDPKFVRCRGSWLEKLFIPPPYLFASHHNKSLVPGNHIISHIRGQFIASCFACFGDNLHWEYLNLSTMYSWTISPAPSSSGKNSCL